MSSPSPAHSVLHWAEISEHSDKARFSALAAELTELGIENEFTQIECSLADFPKTIAEAKNKFAQIRVSGDCRNLLPSLNDRMPVSILSVRSADALVCEESQWWARNFMIEGLFRCISRELKTIDLSGSVFIAGATPDARAVVAVFSRLGFTRFLLTDQDLAASESLANDLSASYFGIQFATVEVSKVTSLAGLSAVAVNTLNPTAGPESGRERVSQVLNELSYFNFLQPGGLWLDLAPVPANADLGDAGGLAAGPYLVSILSREAQTVGARIEDGLEVWVHADLAWIEHCFGHRLGHHFGNPFAHLRHSLSPERILARLKAKPQ